MKYTYIQLTAGNGSATYLRSDQIIKIKQVRSFFFKDDTGSDVTLTNGDTFYFTESPDEILALLHNCHNEIL